MLWNVEDGWVSMVTTVLPNTIEMFSFELKIFNVSDKEY